MATIEVEGATIRYELVGDDGPLIALTPAGRSSLDEMAAVTSALAERSRVLVWDRRNIGGSDMYLEAKPNEQERAAEDLAALIRTLGVGPVHLTGGSAGSRISVMTAVRHPELVKSLAIWAVSGGPYACEVMGYEYHVRYLQAARMGGMAAVAEMPFFDQIAASSPVKRRRLEAMDPREFIEVMMAWNEFFFPHPDSPMIGAYNHELQAIAVPTLVFEGSDDMHPPAASRAVHECIPGSVHVPAPWSVQDWDEVYFSTDLAGLFTLFARVAPQVNEFVHAVEAGEIHPRQSHATA